MCFISEFIIKTSVMKQNPKLKLHINFTIDYIISRNCFSTHNLNHKINSVIILDKIFVE